MTLALRASGLLNWLRIILLHLHSPCIFQVDKRAVPFDQEHLQEKLGQSSEEECRRTTATESKFSFSFNTHPYALPLWVIPCTSGTC